MLLQAVKETAPKEKKPAEKGVSQRRAAMNEDRDRWEESRLISSGGPSRIPRVKAHAAC